MGTTHIWCVIQVKFLPSHCTCEHRCYFHPMSLLVKREYICQTSRLSSTTHECWQMWKMTSFFTFLDDRYSSNQYLLDILFLLSHNEYLAFALIQIKCKHISHLESHNFFHYLIFHCIGVRTRASMTHISSYWGWEGSVSN